MRRFALLFILCALFLCALFTTTATMLTAQKRSALKIMRLYTGEDGMSHFEPIEVKLSPLPGEKTVEQSEPWDTTKSYVVRCAPGHFSDWHNADARRYVVTIRGRAEVEVAGGQKFVLGPGDVVLAEDLTGKGHTFRVLGDSDWVAMFVDMGK